MCESVFYQVTPLFLVTIASFQQTVFKISKEMCVFNPPHYETQNPVFAQIYRNDCLPLVHVPGISISCIFQHTKI